MSEQHRSRLRWIWIAVTVVVLAAAIAGATVVVRSYRTRDSFTVYYSAPTKPDAVRALAFRLMPMPGVMSVRCLDQRDALLALEQQSKSHPEDFVGETMGPQVTCALDVRLDRPFVALILPSVVRTIESDPTFKGVIAVPAPPGGWIVPLR